jgi:hypothetical protein
MATKKKIRVKDPEQEKADAIKDLRERSYINPANWAYKVGDRVQHGNIKHSVVTDVLDDGKILCLHETVTETNYGNPYDHERDIVVMWNRVQPLREYSPRQYAPPSEDRINYFQTSLEGVISKFYGPGVDLDPPYQRGIVWKDEQRQALMDSIFMYADIGKFVFAQRNFGFDGPLYEIIDGKQRFVSLMDYMENRWPWRGKYYYDLHRHDQCHIDNYLVPVAEMREPSMAQKLKVFLRVNVTGVPMETSHLDRIKRMLEEESRK